MTYESWEQDDRIPNGRDAFDRIDPHFLDGNSWLRTRVDFKVSAGSMRFAMSAAPPRRVAEARGGLAPRRRVREAAPRERKTGLTPLAQAALALALRVAGGPGRGVVPAAERRRLHRGAAMKVLVDVAESSEA